MVDVVTFSWIEVELSDEGHCCLNRSYFGACKGRGGFFIVGGLRKEGTRMVTLSVVEIVKLSNQIVDGKMIGIVS